MPRMSSAEIPEQHRAAFDRLRAVVTEQLPIVAYGTEDAAAGAFEKLLSAVVGPHEAASLGMAIVFGIAGFAKRIVGEPQAGFYSLSHQFPADDPRVPVGQMFTAVMNDDHETALFVFDAATTSAEALVTFYRVQCDMLRSMTAGTRPENRK
ncbi:hypothetical protein ACWGOE_07365 [Leucobacter chromiiresistens]